MASKDEDSCEECSTEEKRYSYSEEKHYSYSDSGPLFYAYARRTDSSWASRYLLTFASAAVADEWWALVQQEYPKVGVRSSPQLFSFSGDKFPQKTANDKKFDHLTTKWFYSQIGDSDGTGGRLQDIIPLQASDGTVLTTGGGGSGSGSGFGPAFQNAVQTLQSLMEGNTSQIRTLIDIQSDNNERFARMERSVDDNAAQIKTLSQGQSHNQEQMKELLQQNHEQLKRLAEGQAASAVKLQEALEQSTKASADLVTGLKKQRHQNDIKSQALEQSAKASTDIITELAKQQRHQNNNNNKNQTLKQNTKASANIVSELKKQQRLQHTKNQATTTTPTTPATTTAGPEEKLSSCPHNIRPPPRKIDKAVVGYDYGQSKDGKAASAK